MRVRNAFQCSLPVVFVLVLIAAILSAQEMDPVPLRNWAAPLYWQPPAPEEAQSAKAAELQPREAAITSPLVFVGVAPCRVMDTRAGSGQIGAFGPPSMTGGSTRTVPIPLHPTCGIPLTAAAYSVNVTVVPPGTAMWFLTLWPAGQAQPTVSTLNDGSGQILANAAVVPAGAPNGSISVYVTNNTDVILDINGYYMAPTSLALGAGAVGAPALTVNGANTGLYSPAAGAVALAAAGVNRLTANSTGISVTGDIDMTGSLSKSGSYIMRGGTNNNTAVGLSTGYSTGSNNSAFGYGALNSLISTSWYNTGIGDLAGNKLTENSNTAVGAEAMAALTGAANGWNTAIGTVAMGSSTAGQYNAALGIAALRYSTGSRNIAVGAFAGDNLTNGNWNIDIGHEGVAAEANTIRIGTPLSGSTGQNRAFLAGVRGVTTGLGDAFWVMIDSNGQLGTTNSSRRFKRDIRDMGNTTDTIMGLHPVRFRYKSQGPEAREQFGLVAEEVADVAPELVARDKNGEIESVFYDKVYAMLLNEVQKQHRLIQSQEELIKTLESRLSDIENRVK